MRKNSVLNPPIDPREAGPKPPYNFEHSRSQPGSEQQLTTQADHGEESYVGFGRLKDRSAFITGGDCGIGRAVAIAYAREGANVAIGYLPAEPTDAQETARWVERRASAFCTLQGIFRTKKPV